MEKVCVTRHVEFEAAHLLQGYDGRCRNLHGHSYKMEVTVSCSEETRKRNNFNFVMDFKKLDKILNDYVPDHAFVTDINNGIGTADHDIAEVIRSYNMRIFEMDSPPSAENMVHKFAADIQDILNKEFLSVYTIERICLWETTDSYASWER